MKSFGLAFLLLTILAGTAFAAVSMGNYNDPKNPGKCTISPNLILSPGDTVKDPNADCGRISCGRGGIAEFATCGIGRVSGCEMGDYKDKSLPYPECCARHIICS